MHLGGGGSGQEEKGTWCSDIGSNKQNVGKGLELAKMSAFKPGLLSQ